MFLIFFYGLLKEIELKVTPVVVLGTVTHRSLPLFRFIKLP